MFASISGQMASASCLSNAMYSSIGQNIKSLACPMSDVPRTFVCACVPSHGRNF